MCLNPIFRLAHWGPIATICMLKTITAFTMYLNNMWWPVTSIGAFFNAAGMISISGMILFNYLSACLNGPGYLPLNWKPKNEEDTKHLQFCAVCHGYKAPRSHHCKKCGRCVLKMDHHCPWINNCVGWANHGHFVAFLTFSVMGCVHSTIIIFGSLYSALSRDWYIEEAPFVHLSFYGVISCIFSLGLLVGIFLAVSMLWYLQVRGILRNRTTIEDWILEKAKSRRKADSDVFIYPYNLGFWKNCKQVFTITCEPKGDGMEWPVVEGCNQYTLTIEQIEQKIEKRQRTKLYNILYPATGAWFPISHGIGVFFHPPYTDEPRIKLMPGDVVLVTRWRRYWLFGEKLQPQQSEGELPKHRERGWFPRRCAVELIEGTSNTSQENFYQKKLQ